MISILEKEALQMMNLKWLGHSCFRVECDSYVIIIDPFAPGSVPGVRDIKESAQRVLCSHEHFDHNARNVISLREHHPVE